MPESLTITEMLRNITANIDLDLAVIISDTLNLYRDSLKRRANRSVLTPNDAVRILHIINHLLEATSESGEAELIPGSPVKPKQEETNG